MTATETPWSNQDWLARLGGTPPSETAVRALHAFVRRGLAGALSRRGGVREEDLEDATQEALARILKGLSTFRGDSKFTTWALAIAIRVAFTTLRRRQYQERQVDELELIERSGAEVDREHTRDPRQIVERRSLEETLADAIHSALSERQRTAVLAELRGVPTAVLAEQMGTNPNALYKLHHDARKKLRTALEKAGFSAADIQRELAESES